MADTCSDSTIAALCCVYGDYVNFGAIKTDDPFICGVNAGPIIINSVAVSESGPWGYDPVAQTLTIPSNSNLLGSPSWGYDATNKTMRMQMTQVDGSVFYLPVYSRGTVSEQSMSFQDNGVGINVIHSDETSGVLPASPSAIPNAAGTTNRKYRDHQPYLWFNDDRGRFTHWWNPVRSTWETIRSTRNVLIVHPSGGTNIPEFATLSSAYTYLASLPASPASGDPNQDAAPSASNRWTIMVHGRITETANINARDFIDVFFMPGAQLYLTSSSGPGVMFDGTSSLRATTGKFAANWTSIGAATFSPTGARAASIVRAPTTTTAITSCIQVKDMNSMMLSNIGLFHESGSNSFNHYCIHVTGALAGSTERDGLYLWRVYAIASAVSNPWPYPRIAMFCDHSSGGVYADDCHFVFTPDSFGLGWGVLGSNQSDTAYLYLTECFVNAPKNGACHALYTQQGRILATNSTFEAYGDSNGFGSAAAFVQGFTTATKCIFRIVQYGSVSGSPDAQIAGAFSCCAYINVSSVFQAIFEDCVFSGETSVSTAVTVSVSDVWTDSILLMTGCVLRGGLASFVSLSGTTSSTKRLYRCHLDGPISGTPFGCAAATTAYGTSFLI